MPGSWASGSPPCNGSLAEHYAGPWPCKTTSQTPSRPPAYRHPDTHCDPTKQPSSALRAEKDAWDARLSAELISLSSIRHLRHPSQHTKQKASHQDSPFLKILPKIKAIYHFPQHSQRFLSPNTICDFPI